LFISHNLAVVRHISTRIAVMYLGRVVEIGEAEAVFSRPVHPYTRALLDAIPTSHFDAKPRHHALAGDPGEVRVGTGGCRFAGRCPFAEDRCRRVDPALASLANGHAVACIKAADGSLPSAGE
jgi:peptide/nickel transport system ATP-binding protein/oligopeptide transport system ATP-binding protein